MTTWIRRLRLQGDFWHRFLAWAVPACPFFLVPVFVTANTLIFWLVAGPQRRAVQSNLRALRPEFTYWQLRRGSFRVFLEFAWTCVDSERASESTHGFRWQVEGVEHFDRASEGKGGLLVLTAHMGSYDVAAAVFADHFGRKVHAVRAPEPSEELQEFRKSELARTAGDSLRIAYNTKEGMLGIDLVRALNDGEAVAIQGDRVMFEVSPTECPIDERSLARLPVGPFVLAMTARVPIVPLFVLRTGPMSYRILCRESFECRRTGRDKQADLNRAIGQWCGVLMSVVRKHWSQWFVFEPAFRVASEGRGDVREDCCSLEGAPAQVSEERDKNVPVEGFFALSRRLSAIGVGNKYSQRVGARVIHAKDSSERNGLEANLLAVCAFVLWALAIDSAMSWHWIVRVPLAVGGALVMMQAVTIGIAYLLKRVIVIRGARSARDARAWHTRGHVTLLVMFACCVVLMDWGGTLMWLVAWLWIWLGVANLIAAWRESSSRSAS